MMSTRRTEVVNYQAAPQKNDIVNSRNPSDGIKSVDPREKKRLEREERIRQEKDEL
jgi:hypothetical protein